MRVTKQLFVSAGAVVAMLAVGAWGYGRMPTREIVVHWGLDGRPNGFADPSYGLLILPGLAVLLSAVYAAAPSLMPVRSRIERSGAAYTATWMATLGALFVSQVMIVAKNAGVDLDIVRVSALLVGGVLAVTGNWMGKVRYNYLFGFRTPWTLADERVWDKTHRFTGRLMVLFGVLLLVGALAAPRAWTGAPLFAALIVCAAAPAVIGLIYSILISRREPVRPLGTGDPL
jgi:uncharacterized membrane protein